MGVCLRHKNGIRIPKSRLIDALHNPPAMPVFLLITEFLCGMLRGSYQDYASRVHSILGHWKKISSDASDVTIRVHQ